MELNSKNGGGRIKLSMSIPVVLFLILSVLGIIFPIMFMFAIIVLSIHMSIILIKKIRKIKKSTPKAKPQAFNLQNVGEEEEEKESDENNVFLEDKFFRDDSY